MTKIVVPKPAQGSFNKDRKPSDLLKSQMRHLHELEKNLPHRLQTGHNVEEIASEADASHYIRTVTSRLHPSGKVKVPKPAAGSFHKHRPMSDLLNRQVEHFREMEGSLPISLRPKKDDKPLRLEHEAATYIGKITAALHAQGAAARARAGGESQPPATSPAPAAKSSPVARPADVPKPSGKKKDRK
jgi:hypothetical protein